MSIIMISVSGAAKTWGGVAEYGHGMNWKYIGLVTQPYVSKGNHIPLWTPQHNVILY